jgi:hypothetical protein
MASTRYYAGKVTKDGAWVWINATMQKMKESVGDTIQDKTPRTINRDEVERESVQR